MMKQLAITFMVTFMLIGSSISQAWGVENGRTLAQLIKEYNVQPKVKNGQLLEALMNNPIFQKALEGSPAALLPQLNELNYDQAQAVAIRKQRLAAEMLKQAVLEINDPKELRLLLLFGRYPGLEAPGSVKDISNIETIYDFKDNN